MFDFGFWELLFIAVIALVVLGPERLPVVARSVGRWTGQARAYVRSLSAELDREMRLRELREQLDKAQNEFTRASSDAKQSMRELAATQSETTADPVTPESSEKLPQAEQIPPPQTDAETKDGESK
jgi:sec-independent protein translocase protein TatB